MDGPNVAPAQAGITFGMCRVRVIDTTVPQFLPLNFCLGFVPT